MVEGQNKRFRTYSEQNDRDTVPQLLRNMPYKCVTLVNTSHKYTAVFSFRVLLLFFSDL